MFGEWAIYGKGKVIALVCDNQLFVKPTAGGRAFAGPLEEASPYPGAKPCLQVTDRLDDHEWIRKLIQITAKELPAPKPKGSAKSKVKKPAAKTKPETRAKLKSAKKSPLQKRQSAGKKKLP